MRLSDLPLTLAGIATGAAIHVTHKRREAIALKYTHDRTLEVEYDAAVRAHKRAWVQTIGFYGVTLALILGIAR